MKLYVASSWRNEYQPFVVQTLRERGHEVYDFRHPAPGVNGFSWSDIDPDWKFWTTKQYEQALEHPIAHAGFNHDLGGMMWAQGCVLVLPCGRSAHLEAGWMAGARKPVIAYVPGGVRMEPELMYLLLNKRNADKPITGNMIDVLEWADGRCEHCGDSGKTHQGKPCGCGA